LPPSPNTHHSSHQLNAPVNGLAWSPTGDETSTLAAACGDGTLHLIRPGMLAPLAVPVSQNALLGLIATPHGFATAAENGDIHLTTDGGEPALLHASKYAFLEHLAYSPKTKQVLAATGRKITAVNAVNGKAEVLPHQLPSTIAGLAVSPIGPRVAASHYGGATVLALDNPKNPPRTLPWKGSKLALTYAPDGKWLISAMQENAIHLWRLADGMDLQMRGYPGKIDQFSWSHDGTQLATNGGSGVPLWSFADKLKGPAGTQAKVLADSSAPGILVTAVAMHPKGPFCAIGYTDGLTLLANLADDKAILLHAPATHGAAISQLAWSPTGLHLAAATPTGHLTLTDFTQLI
jgi:WD40 repeat protein